MNINFEVTDESEDGKSRRVWRFSTIDNCVVLDGYREETRPTRRHAFKVDRAYERIHYNYSRHVNHRMTEADVQVPEGVWAAAREKFMAQVRFCRWSEIRGAYGNR